VWVGGIATQRIFKSTPDNEFLVGHLATLRSMALLGCWRVGLIAA
jgi:hypothetical protein